jgi:hypothetical protein
MDSMKRKWQARTSMVLAIANVLRHVILKLNLTSSSDMCTTKLQIYKGLTKFWTSILCPKPTLAKWHFKQCLMGECSHCGIHTLKVYLNELETNQNH